MLCIYIYNLNSRLPQFIVDSCGFSLLWWFDHWTLPFIVDLPIQQWWCSIVGSMFHRPTFHAVHPVILSAEAFQWGAGIHNVWWTDFQGADGLGWSFGELLSQFAYWKLRGGAPKKRWKPWCFKKEKLWSNQQKWHLNGDIMVYGGGRKS